MLTAAFISLALLASATPSVSAHGPSRQRSKRCTGTISSFDDVSDAVECTTININAFTVPVGETLELDLLDGTVVNVLGEITFATGKDWEGPLVEVTGTDITWNGNNYAMDGNGAYWWDGEGSNGGRTKPRPMFKAKFSGAMSNVYLLNSPVQAFSIANPAALVIDGARVDDTDGASLGHNTDGFDVSSSTSLTIQNSVVENQDDCIAINDATDLTFTGNTCSGGHGISIGSIKTGDVVKGVTISNNTVKDSANGLRIKTYVGATDASVSDVVYSGNTVTGCTDYGVIIEQDYTNDGATGDPSNTVTISSVSFTGATTSVEVESGAEQVYVLCGSGSCTGTWDWSSLETSGGDAGSVTAATIEGYSLDGSSSDVVSSSSTSKAASSTSSKVASTTTSAVKSSTTSAKASSTTLSSSTTSKKTSTTTTSAASAATSSTSALFPALSYADGQISDGTAGKSSAAANAVCVTPFSGVDLSTVSSSDLANLKAFRVAADDAEDTFNSEIASATGATLTALKNGKIANKVLKLTCYIQILQIEDAQGKDETSAIATEQAQLTTNVKLDVAAAGEAMKGVA